MAKRKKAKKKSQNQLGREINQQKSQKPRPRRRGIIPVIAVAAQKVHHIVHPVHNQRTSSSTGTEEKNVKNNLTMKMHMKTKKKKKKI